MTATSAGRDQEQIAPDLDLGQFPTMTLPIVINKRIGQYIKGLRAHQGLTIEQAVRKFAAAGGMACGPEKWRGWEQGDYHLGRTELVLVAKALRQDIAGFQDAVQDLRQECYYYQGLALEGRAVPAQEAPAASAPAPKAERAQPAKPIPIRASVDLPKLDPTTLTIDDVDPDVLVALQLGTTIRKARQAVGLTQIEAAELIGVSPNTLAGLEQSRTKLTANLIGKVCAAFELDPTRYLIQAGFLPEDVLRALRLHPELVDEIRQRFAN